MSDKLPVNRLADRLELFLADNSLSKRKKTVVKEAVWSMRRTTARVLDLQSQVTDLKEALEKDQP